jgi:hypothetical protein
MVFVSQDDYTRAVADVTQGRRTGFKEGRLVKAKAPLRAKPKISGRASAKAKDNKGAEATFNPLQIVPARGDFALAPRRSGVG